MTKPVLLWHQQDLRLHDQPALLAAVESGRPVIPVFIWDPQGHGEWAPGAARRWWLHRSLEALGQSYQERLGGRLILRQGRAQEVLEALLDETGAESVYWSRRYEPALMDRDRAIKADLQARGIEAKSFNALLMREPWEVQTKTGTPYRVYSPFWRMWGSLADIPPALDPPETLLTPKRWPRSAALDDLGLWPSLSWHESLAAHWTPGEAEALELADVFLAKPVKTYKSQRDTPSLRATSRLSPYLTTGEISPRLLYHRARAVQQTTREKDTRQEIEHFIKELGWREFAFHVLVHHPHTPTQPLQDKFAGFPWVDPNERPDWIHAWQTGRTGYPIIDAGMRELWTTGWMHNRVRMIVASFLVKDLRISWLEGARWFWDCLVDADLASNTLGWQWAGGGGADAAPYFRVFNPILQGKRFDAEGVYVGRHIPELERMPEQLIHSPWEAGPLVTQAAEVQLDADQARVHYAGQRTPGFYPPPLVDHAEARDAALEAFEAVKSPR